MRSNNSPVVTAASSLRCSASLTTASRAAMRREWSPLSPPDAPGDLPPWVRESQSRVCHVEPPSPKGAPPLLLVGGIWCCPSPRKCGPLRIAVQDANGAGGIDAPSSPQPGSSFRRTRAPPPPPPRPAPLPPDGRFAVTMALPRSLTFSGVGTTRLLSRVPRHQVLWRAEHSTESRRLHELNAAHCHSRPGGAKQPLQIANPRMGRSHAELTHRVPAGRAENARTLCDRLVGSVLPKPPSPRAPGCSAGARTGRPRPSGPGSRRRKKRGGVDPQSYQSPSWQTRSSRALPRQPRRP